MEVINFAKKGLKLEKKKINNASMLLQRKDQVTASHQDRCVMAGTLSNEKLSCGASLARK